MKLQEKEEINLDVPTTSGTQTIHPNKFKVTTKFRKKSQDSFDEELKVPYSVHHSEKLPIQKQSTEKNYLDQLLEKNGKKFFEMNDTKKLQEDRGRKNGYAGFLSQKR